MSDICPHCFKDMGLDTDFKYERGMFADEEKGDFDCPICGEKVYWKSYHLVSACTNNDCRYDIGAIRCEKKHANLITKINKGE